MKRAFTIFILLILGFAQQIYCADCRFRVKFVNDTDQKVVYTFDWIDHPFYTRHNKLVGPYNLAGGELGPGQEVLLKSEYTCGEYYVVWTKDNQTYRYEFSQIVSETRILKPIFDCENCE